MEVHDRTSCFVLYISYWFKYEIVERTRSRSKTVCAPGEHTKGSNDVLRVRANRIKCAMTLVTMLSLHMHQLVKSMVNWNIYNDNIMTSFVAQLKNSRSSLRKQTTVLYRMLYPRNLHEFRGGGVQYSVKGVFW